jgi:aspartate racemase
MELDFFKAKLRDKGIETIVPDDEDRAFVNAIIYDELGKGIFRKETKERLISIMNKLVESGAQGIILGCTEIPMIIQQEDVAVPVFDTGLIHANAAVEFSIA